MNFFQMFISSIFKRVFIQEQKRIFGLQIKFLFSINDLNHGRDTGVVKRFSKENGFGFIKRDGNGEDIFVHFQSILGTGFRTLEVKLEAISS